MSKTATAGFKFKIQMKGHEALTVHDADLKEGCWDCIYELEKQNQRSFIILTERELLDALMQNYFTLKMIHREFHRDATPEMLEIEQFIKKHQKRIFTAMYLDELNKSLPAMKFDNQ